MSDDLKPYLELAAQAWCEPETKGIVMDVELAKSFAKILQTSLEAARKREAELENALEWLCDHNTKECLYMCKIHNRYVFKYRNTKEGMFYSIFGDTPLEAIQNAINSTEGSK